ncbi:DNA polymerase III subunit gamma/tau [Litorilituus lipolyticus]|uniref:DNA polymerase III subunit gamma/tau n=1 Tax=Litorilituus lipolyticus TaxID=2491017 RepID=A0A502L2P7_9GAMM|nr:DNA polymerase III subunit gamma/tau [Litorilituus lipolyticus]TPH16715.1 DNA polymerase III subunit gamma/tau [Litorilituus lipolyticus]
MSYQVLARKWRPKNFQQLMGQEHVVSVLANALSQQRIHHAYLFTGTRGVGKTTIARIFAKSLNCEQGITDTPCGQCQTCLDIDSGHFIDLLEVDAASKTKVDDTREILDNVQYAPTRGRYKVYLIDEVHMLSRHSFNALLKTLEEPPTHVKFILATTDPQKLPVTVLSRCLQFHLKALTVKQIEAKLEEILTQEAVAHQSGCLTLIAKAARGSMRDSLSLTDQAIAQGQGNITLDNIQQMLGGIDHNWVYKILIVLLKQDGEGLMSLSQEIASYAPSYNRLFAELIQLFHQVALMQIVEQHFDLPAEQVSLLKNFANAMSAEDVQLYYQIALNGRKDLPYAADEQAAFDMTLLRLYAFKPMKRGSAKAVTEQSVSVDLCVESLPETNLVKPKAFESEAGVVNVSSETSNDNHFSLPSEKQKENVQNVEHKELIEADGDAELIASHIPVNNASTAEETSSLNEQMVAIEENAQALSMSTTQNIVDEKSFDEVHLVKSEQQSSEQAIDAEQVVKESDHVEIVSPVSAVLATRNMLRSRKKQLEQQTKKSDGASQRHNHEPVDSEAQGTPEEAQEQEVIKNILPEPTVPYSEEHIDPAVIKKANQVDKWAHMIDAMELTARIRQLAIHATIGENSTDEHLILQLDQATKHLNTELAQQQLQDYICQFLAKSITVTIELVDKTVADPYQIQSHINDKRYDYAKALLFEDVTIKALQQVFQAELDEETIQAH